MATTLKILAGLFLVAHGLVHLMYFVPADDAKYPMTAAKSWLVTRAGASLQVVQVVVAVLATVAAVGFVLLALSFWGLVVPTSWFQTIAVVSVVASMLLIIITWSNTFVVAVLIDAAILVWAFWWGPE